MRSVATVLLAVSASALFVHAPESRAGGVAMARPPRLPVVTAVVFPGEGWGPGPYRLKASIDVFDTWKLPRHRLATVRAGTVVTLSSGVNLVSEPDRVKATAPVPEFGLLGDETFYRYMERGEGWADIWANGRWYANADAAFIQNADRSGCGTNCRALEVTHGKKTWWIEVQLSDGRTGWTDKTDEFPASGTR